MDQKTLVTALQAVARKYAAEGRGLSLLMLIPTEPSDPSRKTSIVVSAAWLDERSPREAISEIVRALASELGDQNGAEFARVARVTVIHSSDPFVREIGSAFQVSGGAVPLHGASFGGNYIESGTLLESQTP